MMMMKMKVREGPEGAPLNGSSYIQTMEIVRTAALCLIKW